MKTLLRTLQAILAAAAMTACETSIDARSDDSDDPPGDSTSEPSGTSGDSGSASTTSDPAFAGVTWMGTTVDVSGWRQTATLDASVSGSKVYLNYDKANVWPGVDGVNANAWVFFTFNGRKYAGTFDYMRPGQTTKSANFLIPVGGSEWRPSSGERVGFMVTGLCRDSRRNVSERSNVDWVIWP